MNKGAAAAASLAEVCRSTALFPVSLVFVMFFCLYHIVPYSSRGLLAQAKVKFACRRNCGHETRHKGGTEPSRPPLFVHDFCATVLPAGKIAYILTY